jgi:gamma-glutamyl phosphate reductase
MTDTTTRLQALARKRQRLERQLADLQAQTAEAVAEGTQAGLSAYRMAQLLDLSEAHVGRIRKAVTA